MQISPDKIAEVLERTDLVALISRHVKLRRSGGSFVGLCPFHAEKTGSFNVNPQRRFFKCFGCDAAGDAITFVQKIQGISFVEAVRQLAAEAGVSLEERHDPAAELRRRLLEVTSSAQRIFENCLWNDPRAEAGREHLKARGVSEEAARKFGLGYAPDSWSELTDFFQKNGALQLAVQAGLVTQRSSGAGHYDTFRNRLIIPIRSPEGRTIAFGGRRMASADERGAGPKYLNSRESPLYRKSETLYGMDAARDEIRRSKTAVIVEGYFDAIGLSCAGVRNAVALCSTALTQGHIAVLGRAGAETLCMLLDGDAAGFRAVERLSGALLASGKTIRVAALPDGVDPDEFALKAGPEALAQFISDAPLLSRWLLSTVIPDAANKSLEEKVSAIGRLRRTLDEIPPGMAKTLFIGEIAAHLGVPELELRAYLRESPSKLRPAAEHRENFGTQNGRAQPGQRLNPQEELFAALILAEPSLAKEPEAQAIEEVENIALRLLVQGGAPSEEALAGLDEATRQSVSRRIDEIRTTLPGLDDRLKALRDTSRRIRLQRVEALLSDTKARLLQSIDANAADEDIEELQDEHRRLNELRLKLQAKKS